MLPRVVAIIQGRMASSRLPGKVLLDIAGQPMLARVYARTARATTVASSMVATTTDASDDPVAAFCGRHGIVCARGSQYDVLDRYYQAALMSQADVVVRITADCPAIDPALIDDVVRVLLDGAAAPRQDGSLDFVANRLPPPYPRSFPIGLDVEVCTFGALERAWREGHDAQHREHVMPYMYEGVTLAAVSPTLSLGTSSRGFHIGLCNTVPNHGSYRWTVDTPEDMAFMRAVYTRFNGHDDFSWNDVLELVEREPALAEINANVRHKTLRDVDERALKR